MEVTHETTVAVFTAATAVTVGTLAIAAGAAAMMVRWTTVTTIGALVADSGSGAARLGVG